ncbi:MAG: sugar phosphate isomerase/epimerase [Lentisphaeria bacterium]|nr:sugar phosphate isomerase/epimerase [Lentisphaeria bacterium]
MFLTGFADEASKDFALQIKATRELGWSFIESRAIGAKNLSTLSDEEFEAIEAMLKENAIAINCFGSGVANWQKHPRKEEDFQASITELQNAFPRMEKLGIKMVRGMSFLTPTDEEPDSPELEKIIFKKVRTLVEMCADHGIVYGHENCMNYGGLSFMHTLKLVENVDHENFKLIFDTGNPTFNYRRIGTAPYPLQSAWEFYKNVREHIAYVHIKDGLAMPREDGVRPEADYTYPGDGAGDVRAIVRDLCKTGYDGGFSMEPHVAAVFHATEPGKSSEEVCYTSYVEYGKRFMKILKEAMHDAGRGDEKVIGMN